MIKRCKGIFAVALIVGASGAGFGAAAVAGTSVASGRTGTWEAPSATSRGGFHAVEVGFDRHGRGRGRWDADGTQHSASSTTTPQSGTGAAQTSKPTPATEPTGPQPGQGSSTSPGGSTGQGQDQGKGQGQGQGDQGKNQGRGQGQGDQGKNQGQGQGDQGKKQGQGRDQSQGQGQGQGDQGQGQGDQGQGQGDQGQGQGEHGSGNGSAGNRAPQAVLGNQGQGDGGRNDQGQSQETGNGRTSQGGCTSSCQTGPQSRLAEQGQTSGSVVNTSPAPSPQSLLPFTQASTTPVAPVTVTTPTTPTRTPTTPNTSSGLGSNLSSGEPIGATRTTTPRLVTTPLGIALLAGPGTTLPVHTGTPLLTAAIVPAAATTATNAAGHPNRPAHRASRGGTATGSPVTRVINTIEHQIERVIPSYVWAAIAASLALAAIGGLAAFVAGRRVRRQAGQFAAVSAAAMTDPLTGILNRRGFIDALERELARARRYGLMFTLAYVDVRGLKAVNDTEGHLAGDRLLNEAAHLLKDSARADDVVGRIGGDEMGLLLVEQGAEGADAVIRRVTSQIPERRAALGIRSPWDLTVGTASFPEDGSTVNELLATADRRLYEQRGIALR